MYLFKQKSSRICTILTSKFSIVYLYNLNELKENNDSVFHQIQTYWIFKALKNYIIIIEHKLYI